MIDAVFYRKHDLLRGFSVSGHSGYSESGSDIVCAAVSSAVQLTCNTITDFFGSAAEAEVNGNEITLKLTDSCGPDECTEQLLSALVDHLENISQEYKGTISITITEV